MSAERLLDVLDVLDNLPSTLRAVRLLRGKSLRDVEAETSVNASTIMRLEQGGDCVLSNARTLLAWIGGTDEP